MSIRWDPLLARALARELEDRLERARLRAIRLDARTRDAILFFRECTLLWRLHPDRGWLSLREPVDPEPTDLTLRARVRRVWTPPDERIVILELIGERAGTGGHEVIVELLGNRLNAVVTEGRERVARHVLATREGKRVTRVGHPYRLPEPTRRTGVDGELPVERWVERLEVVPPPDRARELTRTVAWVSPLNAPTFLGEGASGDDRTVLVEGHVRWREVVEQEDGSPVLLETERGLQPYPFPLAGIRGEPASSLLDTFEAVARAEESEGTPPPALGVSPALLERAERAVAQAERRVVRLRAQLDGREDPKALRALGDLILACYASIPPGASMVKLTDFTGSERSVELDPGKAANENAETYYDRASRSERAAQRLPGLIAKAEEEAARLRALLQEARSGEAEADEVRAGLPELPPAQHRGGDAPLLPYRSFRSSGGLEIRVGRGAKQNDDLTFRHSAPNDVWLHARHAAGAHVILRWSSDGNPPARDLAEAGTLAALHSKARTSSTVPVDWTRRKYVRKPRRSAPGTVVPDRVSTIFVRPDPALAERLDADSG